MVDNIEYFTLEIIGNKKTKSGDQISEWIHPKVQEMKMRMNEWDWNKPFEFEVPEKSIVTEFDEILIEKNLPDKLPVIGKFLLFDSSKLTDFIRGSFLDQYGLIVSDKAKIILEKFNIGVHKFYPITLSHKGIDYNNFYFLKCLTNSNEFIDIENSEFYTQKGFFDKESKRHLKFTTNKDFLEFKLNTSKHKLILFAKKIKLKNEFPNFDLFSINDFVINEKIVSQNLNEALSKLTGVKLTKTKEILS